MNAFVATGSAEHYNMMLRYVTNNDPPLIQDVKSPIGIKVKQTPADIWNGLRVYVENHPLSFTFSIILIMILFCVVLPS